MTYRVQISEKALSDIESVLQWFERQSASSAGQGWFDSLWKALDTLENRPERCSLAAEAEDVGMEVRQLLLGRRQGQYRILFRIDRKTVYVLRIWHSARDHLTSADL